MLVLGMILLAVIVVGIFAYLMISDVFTFGSFPDGVSIVGVEVSGLTKSEAVTKCQHELARIANRPLTLKVDEDRFKADPDDIGLSLEYDKMVDEAYKQAWSVNLFERMTRKFLNRPKKINISIMASNNDELVKQFVEQTLPSINREAHDAYVDVTTGAPVIAKALDGRQADLNQLLTDTKNSLGTPERVVNVQVQRTPAQIQDSAISRFIIINLAEHTLTLYDREKAVVQYPVACGSSSFPTTVGHWKIVTKEKNPAWRNPGSAWAASMPPYIAPGPGNPLGTRAMALNARGELIHGTPNPWSVGQSVSHGCVRMYMADVEQLFEMVEVGTSVYIIKGPGDPGWDVTVIPKWMKE